MGGICKKLECHPIKIGGHTDHIHILYMLSTKIALMKLLEEIGYLKSDYRSGSNFYKEIIGDDIDIMLAAAAFTAKGCTASRRYPFLASFITMLRA